MNLHTKVIVSLIIKIIIHQQYHQGSNFAYGGDLSPNYDDSIWKNYPVMFVRLSSNSLQFVSSKAGNLVFDSFGEHKDSIRLMCLSHVHRNN